MRATVCLRTADGRLHHLGQGDVIGRTRTAALVLDDPRVSEAHAFVSLRRGQFYLLSLRRLVAVAGAPQSEVKLRPGLDIELADGVVLRVEAVELPGRVLAIETEQLGRRVLGQVSSLYGGAPPRVVGRFDPGAPAHLWCLGEAWRATVAGETREVGDGDELAVGDTRFRLRLVEVAAAGLGSTEVAGGVTPPLRIIAHYDTVEIHVPSRPPLSFGGVGARILSELVAFDGPVSWAVVAGEVWPDQRDNPLLRHRWDVALGRLRGKLRGAGVRGDLIRSDGVGTLQIVLYPHDTVEDRT